MSGRDYHHRVSMSRFSTNKSCILYSKPKLVRINFLIRMVCTHITLMSSVFLLSESNSCLCVGIERKQCCLRSNHGEQGGRRTNQRNVQF